MKMIKQHDEHLSKSAILFFSLILPALIMGICLLYNKNFFNIDDAVNEFLGYYTQYGRIWSEGKIPFIVDSLMFGGNGVIELSHSPFNPQVIIASLIAWFCEKKQVAGLFIVYSSLFIISLSSLSLGRFLNFKKLSALTCAAFILIQPPIIFMYCASWWNSLVGQSWGFASIVTLFFYARNPGIRNFLLNFCALFFLLISAWFYSVLTYILLYAVIALYAFIKSKVSLKLYIKYIILLIFPFILAALVVSPLFLEYIYNNNLHDRFSSFFNNNFLTLPLSGIIFSFFPTYYEFINRFGGYKVTFFALGFSTIFIPAALFFRSNIALFLKDATFKFFLLYALLLILLTQTPEVISSTRWPIRYVPFLTFFLAVLTFYSLEYAKKSANLKASFYGCAIFLASCLFISCSRIAGRPWKLYLLEVISMALVISVIHIVPPKSNIKKIYYMVTPLLCLIIMILGVKITNFNFVPTYQLFNSIKLPSDMNVNGYFLRLGSSSSSSNSFIYPAHSRGGIHNIKTINGYTPLGYRASQDFMPSHWTGLIFNTQKSLDNLLDNIPDTNVCRAVEWRISTIVLEEKIAKDNLERLGKCGYRPGGEPTLEGFTYFSLPESHTYGWKDLPPFVIPPLKQVSVIEHSNNYDIIRLPERKESIKLIFPRQFWYGYTATLNNKLLKVQPDDVNMLVQINVPPGDAGVMKLEYFPITWKKYWFLPLVGLFGIIGGIIYLRKHKFFHPFLFTYERI